VWESLGWLARDEVRRVGRCMSTTFIVLLTLISPVIRLTVSKTASRAFTISFSFLEFRALDAFSGNDASKRRSSVASSRSDPS